MVIASDSICMYTVPDAATDLKYAQEDFRYESVTSNWNKVASESRRYSQEQFILI